ncbi:switch-associated protein 70-like isoform X2 [Rhynchophorus ferrugineus]|uniref:switch-associated protein 70-like isoform X2 n=1 Tax=Rhynchophorus ferrugineus TaxID=354439 RepID=UPI003FCD3B3F
MSVLLDNVTNCVCLAFDVLQQDQTGFVNKSKLKVLTANIGTLLDLYGVEKGLEHFKSASQLSFDQYKYYLQNEVFSSFPNKLPMSEIREYESRIAEVCAVAQTLANSLGCIFDEDDFNNLSTSMGNFRLGPFIAVLESRCIPLVKDDIAIKEAVTDIYQRIVEDVIKKGYLSKKGYIFPTMKEYWFVLRPSELTYYKSRSEKDKCDTLIIEKGSRIEPQSTGFRFLLHTPDRHFELGASDHMTRLQWISSLQLAIDHSDRNQSYQRLQAAKRRIQRQGRIQEMTKARALLQEERNARQLAEGQAKELEAVVREDSKKLSELLDIKIKLEKLLEEETQAKRDEEIVRALQARILTEEWEKREEMERLQDEQHLLLEEERRRRKEYEERQQENKRELKNAVDKLAELEREKQALDVELRNAREKIVSSEGKKDFLEAQLYQYTPVLKSSEGGIRRAHSFVPSTKEKPLYLEVRSATLKRPLKK